MADFEDLEWFESQAANPAAPAGARQASRAGAGATAGESAFAQSKLASWVTDEQVGMTGAAQSWFSGANREGPLNGWSTPFVDTFFAQRDEAAAQGELGSFFDRDGATGVVTYDHASRADGAKQYRFGDIYEGGKFQGNVYDLYDQDTANVMMSTWVLDADEQRDAFEGASFEKPKDGLRNPKLDEMLLEKRAFNDKNLEKAYSAMDHEADVTSTETEFREGAVDEGIVAGGAAGGAALGAGAGLILGPVGSGVGALIGGAAGGLGAWLNRDSLTEQAARAYEITKMSRDQFGMDAAAATGVHQWSKFGMRLLSPGSNLIQGSVDAYGQSKGGDGEADFYRVDEKGERGVSKWLIGADVAASVADGALQFASPLGLLAYSSVMSGTVGGQVAELAATGGATFDDRSGTFDNIFFDTDENGERSFDKLSAAAGIGAIGIDAIQLGFARGLAGKVNASRALVGKDAAFATAPGALGRNTTGRLPKWLGGHSNKEAAKDAVDEVRMGAYAYAIDDAGKAVSRRATLSILAPSEQISSLSARVFARRAKARAEGAISTDDIFRTAQAMASGEMKMKTAVANAMGEGYEEGVQSALEPLSHDANMDGAEMFLSAAYGFAGGLGMGMAANTQMPGSREILEAQAQQAHWFTSGGGQLTKEELANLTDDDLRRRVSAMSKAEREVASAAYQKTVESLSAQNSAGVAGVYKVIDAWKTQRDSELAKATKRTDGALVMTPLEAAGAVDADGNIAYGSIPAEGVATSAVQMMTNLRLAHEGKEIARDALVREHARLQGLDQSDPETAAQTAKLADQVEQAQRVTEWSDRIQRALERDHVNPLLTEADPIKRAADIADLNLQLQLWYSGEETVFEGEILDAQAKRDIARAVTQLWARDPHDSAGSYQLLLPQVSVQLTNGNADNVVQVSSGVLKAIRGDHDGDKLRQLNQLWLDDDAFSSGRSGAWYVGTGTAVHVDAPKQEKYVVDFLARASKPGADPKLSTAATDTLTKIGAAIKKRYSSLGMDSTVDAVVERFYNAVRSNAKDARATLLDGLAKEVGGPLNEFARNKLSNEWLWVDQLVRSHMQAFQEVYVAYTPRSPREVDDLALDTTPKTKPVHRSRSLKERAIARAASAGQTMALVLKGDSPFRMFQKLHYSSLESPVLSAMGVEPMTALAMAKEYERLGQLATQSELDRVREVDPITGNVVAALQALAADAQAQTALQAQRGEVGPDGKAVRALSQSEAMVLVANAGVADFEPVKDIPGEYRFTGKTISLAQMLLKLEVQRDQKLKHQILEADPSLRAKHFRLLELTKPGGGRENSPVNAERAFVEVFAAQPLALLLGPDAEPFGPQLTVEQFVKIYASRNEDGRSALSRELRSWPAYLGRKEPKNLPYKLSEIAGKQISPYRSVVDSILGVGNHRHVDFAERSSRTSADFVEAHGFVRQAMRAMLDLSPKRELTVETITRLIEANPDFASKIFDLIPNAAASVVFEVRGEDVFVNNWFYEMFAEKDAKAAEMIYWRAMLLEQWRALGVKTSSTDGEESGGREFDRLKRRMHRVMYRVAPSKALDGGLLQRKFLDELWRHDSVDSFIEWVNKTPGMLEPNEAPIAAWYDDVAEFDPERSKGGWTTSLEGAELREAIRSLKTMAGNLVQDMVEEQALLEADTRYLDAVDRVMAADAGAEGGLEPGDRAIYDRIQEALDNAGELAVALGPAAMIFETTVAAWGFYGQAHNKGKNPAHVEAYGMFDARRDAFGFVHNYSRVMGHLTSVDLDAVGANMGQVLKDTGRTMDDYGNVVEWGKPTVAQFAAMMRDPKMRKAARAMVMPTALERTNDGQLSEQMLLGKSLQELVEGSTYDELYSKFDRLSQESAFKYGSLVDAISRQFGGHAELTRAANDLVIRRLQSAKRVLDLEDVEAMTTEAYYEIVKVLQLGGSLAAADKVAGSDQLGEVHRALKLRRREAHKQTKLGKMTEEELGLFRADLEKQHAEDVAALTKRAQAESPGPEQQEILARIQRLEDEHDRLLENLDLLDQGDDLAPVLMAYGLPQRGVLSPAEHAARTAGVRRQIVRYIDDHPSMRSRIPSLIPTIGKLQSQLSDKDRYDEIDMSDAEWDELSRGVIGLVLTDAAGPVGNGVSVRLFPGEKNIDDTRYYDHSGAYLIDRILDPASPLMQAAAKAHVMAKRQSDIALEEDIIFEVERTIFDEKRLGPWSEEVVIGSVEANQRLDSAAAAPAVAISGQSPKLEATVSAATERRFTIPGDELLSTTTITGHQLEGDLFDDVEVTFPGAVTGQRPLAQMNNRFARSVTVEINGQVVDLLAENPDLGRRWLGNTAADVPNAPVEIHVERLAEALAASATRRGVPTHQIPTLQVNVAFFHPESQPAEQGWYNNLWFEGTSFKLNSDRHGSLNETLWFALGSLSPEGQAAALDAAKNGKQAMQVIKPPSAADREADEQDWQTDLATVLRRKTRRILETDLGFGKLEPEFYNAVFKGLKLRHWILDQGEVYTAEQAIAMQQAGHVFTEPQLWTPSDKVLRSLLGEQGDQGVPRVFEDQIDFDTHRVPNFQGLTPSMMERFNEGLTGGRKELAETRIMHRARQLTLSVRPMLPRKIRDQFERRLQLLSEERNQGYLDRGSLLQVKGGFNPVDNLNRAVGYAASSLEVEHLEFAYASLGIPFIGPRRREDSLLTQMVLRDLNSAMEANSLRAGWILRGSGETNPLLGVISSADIGGREGKGQRILFGDIVAMEIDTFGDDSAAAKKQIDLLVDRGATVVLVDNSNSAGDLRGELAGYLQAQGHRKIIGSKHAFRPRESLSEYQTEHARATTLTEIRGVSPVGRVAVFNAVGIPMQEGGAHLNNRSKNSRGAIKVVSDLVPVSNAAGFGLPQLELKDDDQVSKVIRHLEGLNNPEDLAALKKMAKAKGDDSFDAAWAKMMERFGSGRGVLPERGERFESGDMIPLVDQNGRVLIYRHGMKRPSRAERKRMFRTPMPGSSGYAGSNVAIYSSDPEPAATVHSGSVVGFTERAGYGLSVELEVKLQEYGDKRQLQMDGTKYTIVPMPDPDQPGAPVLPDHQILENWDIELISDLETRLGKEGAEFAVIDHRHAFAALGIDLLPRITEFLFPGSSASPEKAFQAQQLTRSFLRRYAGQVNDLDVNVAHSLINLPTLGADLTALIGGSIEAVTGTEIDQARLQALETDASPEAQITRAALIYLSTPGADPRDILKSGSFDDMETGPDSQSLLMPPLFTQVFDNAPIGSPLRQSINRELNAALNRQHAKPGESYQLMENFDLVIKAKGKQMTGILSFPEVHSSGDNPVTNAMSFRPGLNQQVSAHSAMTADQAIGARTFASKVLGKAQEFKAATLGSERVTRFSPDVFDDGAVAAVLSDVPVKDRSFDFLRAPLPAELERNGLAHDAMVGFRQPIDTSDSDRWSDAERDQYEEGVRKVLTDLNMPRKMRVLVDGWVRQHAGRPHGMLVDGTAIEPVTGRAALEYLRQVSDNVSKGFSPVLGAYVPLLHAHDLKLIYRHQQTASRPWVFRQGLDTDAVAESWDSWVATALGSALASNLPFERFYLLPTDGFMHTYQNATDELTALPVSIDVLVNEQVMTLEVNNLVHGLTEAEIEDDLTVNQLANVASIDPRTNARLTNPMVLDTARAQLADLFNGQRIAGEYRGELPPSSEKAKHEAYLRKYRKDNQMATPVPVSAKDFHKNGNDFIHASTTTNALVRGLINLRVGTALLNPALYVSMPIELAIRSSLDKVTNLVTGQGVTGFTARKMAQASQAMEGNTLGDLLRSAGLETAYTPEQQQKMIRAFKTMGLDPEFKAMLWGELNWQRPIEHGVSKLGRGLEAYARIGSRMQDPTWGVRGDRTAQRYLQAALSHIATTGALTGVSVDQVIEEVMDNPMILQRRFPEAHQAGIARVADIRSLKPTLLSQMLRGIYEPLSSNPNPGVNMFGNLVLRMPMLFSTYAGNVATTILGLQGVDQLAAAFLDGKPKGLLGRIQAKMRGDELNPETDLEFDMSSILEGANLVDAFIRGGMTHTGLFAFALMAGSLGISGEDDESKRRRRAAELQGAVHVYDPRKVENDFRNADEIYLDWLPWGWDSMFKDEETGRAMVQTHWILKQFISPMVGIEKFMETGNFNHVKWGFADALGAFPLINTNTVVDTFETMAVFEQAAAEASLEGTDEAQVRAAGLLTSVVGAYEKMLFENSFLSALYIGMDEYDRDPYLRVMTDHTGTIAVDGAGQPRETNRLQSYRDEETGEIRQAYQSRSGESISLAVLTENRPFMAGVASLFTGLGDSEYLRYNMVPKVREIELQALSESDARQIAYAAYKNMGYARNLSVDESLRILKHQWEARGERWNEDELMPLARQMSATSGGAPMSRILPDGREALTTDGARAVFEGLWNKQLGIEDPELGRFHIPFPMREEIAKEWSKELMAQGIELGLQHSEAEYRMKRILYGPKDNPHAMGLADILFSESISFSDTVKYTQLNTTYVMGPDGRPWATGWRRDGAKGGAGFLNSVLGASGILPLKRQLGAGQGMSRDERLNSVDDVHQLNTGLRGLQPIPEPVPTPEEIGKAIEEAIKEAAKQDYSAFKQPEKRYSNGYGYRRGGYTPYKRRSYSGGGYSSSGYPNFTRMYALPDVQTPYAGDIPFINTSNPILRRANVRRERVWSERGRLNQWQ